MSQGVMIVFFFMIRILLMMNSYVFPYQDNKNNIIKGQMIFFIRHAESLANVVDR